MVNQSDEYFLIWLESLSGAYRDAMIKKDAQALQGLTAFDISRGWAVTNTGSLIMSYLFKETLKTYKIGAALPWLSYNVIESNLRKRHINEERMNMVLDAFKDGGFIEIKETEVRSLDDKDKVNIEIRLTSLWGYYLTSYNANKKQTMTFPSILGRQIYASYLAREKLQGRFNTRGSGTGISSFKYLLIILNNATKSGYINSKEGEDMFYKMGGVVAWNEVGEGDEIKQENIKFFVSDDGKKKKINDRVIKAYNGYMLPNYNLNSQKRGLI